MTTANERVMNALRTHGSRRRGDMWTCPAHDDANPSLSVSEGEDGRALLYCQAGCPTERIVGALGLQMSDLFSASAPAIRRNGDGKPGTGTDGPGTAYLYKDEQGQVVFRVIRGPIVAGKKSFGQHPPDGNGGWRTGQGAMNGVRRVLYRLPELLAAGPTASVFIPEGEKDCESLAAIGLIATTNPGGAGKWRKCEEQGEGRFSEPLRDRHVVILPDNDESGRRHAASVAARLHSLAASVKVLELPGLPNKGDVSDWLAAGGTRAELMRLVSETPEWTPHEAAQAPHSPQPAAELPEIIVNDRRLREVTGEALAALQQANASPTMFVRSGSLVRVRSDETGRPIIDDLKENELRGVIERSANCVRVTKEGETYPKSPPLEVVRDVLSLGRWPFPSLVAVVEVPVLRPDGSVLDRPGHDARTGLFYAPSLGLRVPKVSERPRAEEVAGAVALLRELLEGFPFVREEGGTEACRANAMGLLLTPIVRQLSGPVPLALVDAPQAGTGKSLLADLVGIIDSGTGGSMMTAPTKEEEWSKQMTSLLARGSTLVVIDNVEAPLSSAALASTLTSEQRSDRLMGRNDARLVFPQRATWVATGNNLRLGGDMPRRSYWIRLDAQESRPWKREGFRHPDLKVWAREHRGDLVGALLTLARAWFAAGSPAAAVPTIGGFERWAGIVGGILAHAGVSGFLGNQETMWDEQDEEAREWESWLGAWRDLFAEDAVPIFRIVEVLTGVDGVDGDERRAVLREHLPQNLAEALAKVGSDSKAKTGFSRRLGVALTKHHGTRYGASGIHLERAGTDTHRGAALWRVCCTSGSAEDVGAGADLDLRPLSRCRNASGDGPPELPHLPQAAPRLCFSGVEREPGAGPEDLEF